MLKLQRTVALPQSFCIVHTKKVERKTKCQRHQSNKAKCGTSVMIEALGTYVCVCVVTDFYCMHIFADKMGNLLQQQQSKYQQIDYYHYKRSNSRVI